MDIVKLFQDAQATEQDTRQKQNDSQPSLAAAKDACLQPLIDVWQTLGTVALSETLAVQKAFYLIDSRPDKLFCVLDDGPTFTADPQLNADGTFDSFVTIEHFPIRRDTSEAAALALIQWISVREQGTPIDSKQLSNIIGTKPAQLEIGSAQQMEMRAG